PDQEETMPWTPYYQGDSVRHELHLADPPPWRVFPRPQAKPKFRPSAELITAINTALSLRRPLLVTGLPGSGKSAIIDSVADELCLDPPLRWDINSRTELKDGLYRYDVLGRIHAQELAAGRRGEGVNEIAPFMRLGPLGTALLPSEQPRPLLIDEIDKGDLDLPGDLLDVLERGTYEIPELVRYRDRRVEVRMWDTDKAYPVEHGRVACTTFPFIVMTSNEERDFPPAFLRRCIPFRMPTAGEAEIREIVRAHLDLEVPPDGPVADLVTDFAKRLAAGQSLAIDQLLNAVFILTGSKDAPDDAQKKVLLDLLTQKLTGA
ncbi:MAG TPA: AAA family ATPase, partial [Trebonia sp.]|nr:AAA family ATPase [Trebonia sp.]